MILSQGLVLFLLLKISKSLSQHEKGAFLISSSQSTAHDIKDGLENNPLRDNKRTNNKEPDLSKCYKSVDRIKCFSRENGPDYSNYSQT